jgi:hypothetical protein
VTECWIMEVAFEEELLAEVVLLRRFAIYNWRF